jgi:hypothetical protein
MLVRMTRRFGLAVVWLSGLAACTSPPTPNDASSDAQAPNDAAMAVDAAVPYPTFCENLSGVHCLLPFPSSRFLATDTSTTTGRRVALPVEAMPINAARPTGVPVDPAIYNRFDGFSPATSIITAFTGGDIDPTNLADERHIGDSLLDASPTLIFEVTGTTLTRVAHFAEIEQADHVDPNRRPLYLRPAARLRPNTRYIVAIRNLTHVGGAPIGPSDYFRALRDNTPLPLAMDIESRRAAFEDVFTHLSAASIDRPSLIQAWDFWTASDASIYSDMLAVRDQGLAALTSDGPSCSVTMSSDNVDSHIFRRIYGTVRVPLFIGGTNPNQDSECRLVRDASGHVTRNTTTTTADVPFTISIPVSVQNALMTGGSPGRLLQYGHGLLGSQSESETGWLSEFADTHGYVIVAVDWWGLMENDVARVAGTLGELSRLPATSERLAQGVFNFLAIVRSLITTGACQSLPELQINGHLVFDPSERYYQGNSQGGIMGSTVAALSTDITRFGIGVGGMSYSLMIPRSTDATTYIGLMYNNYRRDQLVSAINWVMSQAQWDLTDPSTFVSHIRGNTFPCTLPECTGGHTPAHHVLFQIGRDDDQVPNVASALSARTMVDDAGHMLPLFSDATHVSSFVPYGLPTTSGPEESGLVVYAIPGTPVLPLGARSPPAGITDPAHEGVRRDADAQTQLEHFFHPTGDVIQTCAGTCM